MAEERRRSGFIRGFIRPGDIILAAALIVLSVAGIFLAQSGGEGAYVSVRQDGREIYGGSLFADRELVVRGEYTSVIRIEGGQARFVSSDCPNHDCVRSGAVGKAGQSAACLPNRVVITISGGGSEVDDIAR